VLLYCKQTEILTNRNLMGSH